MKGTPFPLSDIADRPQDWAWIAKLGSKILTRAYYTIGGLVNESSRLIRYNCLSLLQRESFQRSQCAIGRDKML